MVDLDSTIDTSNVNKPILGATSTENEESKQTDDIDDGLPMVVWLKGDEDYVDDFCLDAEAAMKEIGIRRSRLTQISGKELRVGRMRIDRYVRPVYRRKDIEDYKKWTRATASHLRSSSVLEQASQKLEQKVSDIENNLEDRVEQIHDDLQNQISEFSKELESHKTVLVQTLGESVTTKLDSLKSSFLGIETSLFDQLESIKETMTFLTPDDLDTAFAAVRDPIASLNEAQVEINEFTRQLASLLTPLEDIRDHLVNDLQEIGPSLGELYTLLFDTSAHTKESLEAQNRFNRKMADMIAKVVEFQRDSLLKQQALLVRFGKMQNLDVKSEQSKVRFQRRGNLQLLKRRRIK